MYSFTFTNNSAFFGEFDGLLLSTSGNYVANEIQRNNWFFKLLETLGMITNVTLIEPEQPPAVEE